ncbi:hypothetical protein [Sphingomonas canadensis]|nr:hypothetical protein [Sphingomonas canadensis]
MLVTAVRMIGLVLLAIGIAMQLSGSANAKALYAAAAMVLAYAQFRAFFLRQTQRRFERIIAAHERDEANGSQPA